jgi:hypothetical protein
MKTKYYAILVTKTVGFFLASFSSLLVTEHLQNHFFSYYFRVYTCFYTCWQIIIFKPMFLNNWI